MQRSGARESAGWRDPTNDPDVERRIHQLALPVALVLAFAIVHSGLRGIARTFLTMWVHECGHAVAAWLCGFAAFPGPWRTPIAEGRSVVVTLLVLGGLSYGGWRAWKAGARGTCVAAGALAVVALVLTLGLRVRAAQALILFGGDGGCLLLGALMMATIYVSPGSALHRGWLRWGFLVIGALAFADAFTDWWHAGHSREGVVFGSIEGVGDSDPTRLVMEHGWSEARLVSRYLTLAWTCLVMLGALYLHRLFRSVASTRL
jgi:hypothetical protein